MSKPTPRGLYDNWANSDLPFAEKVLLALKNNAIKLKNRSDCCGNYGEPGCWIGPHGESGPGSHDHGDGHGHDHGDGGHSH